MARASSQIASLRHEVGRLGPIELGVRQDGSDADVGAGLDGAAGLVLADAGTGLAVDLRVHRLRVHQAAGFAESGIAISVSYDPSPSTPLDQFSWRVYGQFNETSQVIDRERMTFGFGPPLPSLRQGTLDYKQVGYGGSLRGQQWLGDPDGGFLITAGASYRNGCTTSL